MINSYVCQLLVFKASFTGTVSFQGHKPWGGDVIGRWVSSQTHRLGEEIRNKHLHLPLVTHSGFPGGSVIKNLPAMWEMQVRSLGQEDPLEKEMTTHCTILTWKIPWTEKPGWLQCMGSQRVGQGWAHTHDYNSLLTMFLTLGLEEEAKSHQYSLNLKAKTVQGLVRPMWNFAVERKWKGTSVLCSAALTSFPEFSSGRKNSQPYTQHWCPR